MSTEGSSATPPSNRKEMWEVLGNREFRAFLIARLMATLAIQMQSVIIAWQVYDITHDPLSLGYIGLAEAIPAISFALLGGHYVDKNDRRNIILAAQLALVLCTGVMIGLTMNFDSLKAGHIVWPIYTVMFSIGVVRAFIGPSYFSFLSQLVPRTQYARASGWNSTVWQSGAVAGPALGGLLYSFIGPLWTYAHVIALLGIAFIAITTIERKPLPSRNGGAKEPLLESLSQGLRFVFSTPIILSALALDLFAVLFGGATALLPVFASDILKVGPEGLGMLRAAPAAGAVLVALILALRPPGKNAGRALLLSVAGFGCCIVGFGYSRVFELSLALLFLSGAFDCVSVVIRSTILQLHTPDHMRGRVASVNTMFIGSSNEIGAFESGVTAKWFGARGAVMLGGTLTLLVVAGASLLSPQIRNLNLKKQAEA